MLNHAFIITVHKEPEVLKKVLNHLQNKNHFFWINIDKKSNYKKQLEMVINGFQNVIEITNFNVVHSGFSQVECTVYFLKKIINYDIKMDYIHFISGQDYPCVPVNKFDVFFENNNPKSFMHMDTTEECIEWRKKKYLDRVQYYNFGDVFNSKIMQKFHIPGIINRMFLWKNRGTIEGLWGGWNWFSWHREVALYVISYYDTHTGFVNRFRYTWCSDELLFPTILHGKEEDLNIEPRNSLRFIEWHPKRDCNSLPLILEESEYNDIVKSGCFFCRKVEFKTSRKLITLLDKKIQDGL